jgi:IS5 family transposase
VVIPRKGKPSQVRRDHEHRRGFRRLVKWRTGCEGRISYLKRRYGFDRTLLDGLDGAQTWCGLGVLAHNTVKIAHLMQHGHPARSAETVTEVPPAHRPAGDAGPPGDPPRAPSTAA